MLVGPSGCGKSTLLRTIAGLEDADQGKIEIGGQVVNDVRPRDRDIAMVFQNYALYPYHDRRSRTSPSGCGRARPRGRDRAKGAPRCSDARHQAACSSAIRASSPAVNCSASPSAAPSCATPALFLFDEPLSNLDAQLRDEMRGEIKRLHQELGRP